MTAHEQALEAIKTTPALTVSGMIIFGFQVQDWLILFTCILTILQVFLLVRRLLVTHRVSDDKDPACAESCAVVQRYHREKEKERDDE